MQLSILNLLRAVSILAIIFGHVCLQQGYEPIARWCGYLFVQVFFHLLGIRTLRPPLGEDIQSQSYLSGWNFLAGRWKKLSKVYYPFLLVSVVALLLLGKNVSWQSVLAHVAYLNYPLQYDLAGVGFGHLWYISMQMLCYWVVAVMCFGPMRRVMIWASQGIVKPIIGALLTLAVCWVGLRYGIPCRIFIVLASYVIVFIRAKEILGWADAVSAKQRVVAWVAFALLNALTFSLFLWYDLNSRLLLRDVLVLLTACSWIWLCIATLRAWRCPKVMEWVSRYSFELYLVHSPLVFGV